MRKGLLGVLLAAGMMLGCLDFTSQEIVLGRSPHGKDLYLLVVYHGLYQQGQGDGAAQLSELLQDGDKFYLGANAFRLELNQMREKLKPELRAERPATYQFLDYFVNHADVGMGRIYQDAVSGCLDCYQVLRLRNVKKALKLGNAALGEQVAQADPSTSSTMARTEKLWIETCRRRPWKIVNLAGTAVVLDLPADPTELPAIRREFLQDFFKDLKTTESQRMWADFLGEHTISLAQRKGGLKLTVGDPATRFNHLRTPEDPEKNREYETNLVAVAQKSPRWSTPLDSRRIIKEFKTDPRKFFEAQWFKAGRPPRPGFFR